jgi:hypothetical protein
MTTNASTTQIDAEMNTTVRTAAAYLQHRLYPQAAALGVVLEAVAPGCYRVQPQEQPNSTASFTKADHWRTYCHRTIFPMALLTCVWTLLIGTGTRTLFASR